MLAAIQFWAIFQKCIATLFLKIRKAYLFMSKTEVTRIIPDPLTDDENIHNMSALPK